MDEIITSEAVNITECGRQAVLRLGDGDMRKILNVLQSTHMAFDVVDAKNVYACTCWLTLTLTAFGVVDAKNSYARTSWLACAARTPPAL